MSVEFKAPARDPLLAALIEKLPAPGTAWANGDREAWLGLMRSAFDLVYGRDGAVQVSIHTVTPEALPRELARVSPRVVERQLDADESSVAA